MPTMKMTKKNIDALPAPDPSGKQTIYWAEDRDLPGLGILVSGSTTTRSWVVQGKLKDGKTRRVTLDRVSVLDLAQAWEKARPVLANIHSNIDPKAKARKPATVREACETYLNNPRLRPKTRKIYRDRVERHLADWLDLPIASVNPDMVEARFLAISAEVGARREAGGSHGGVRVTGAASANGAMAIFRSLWRDQKARDPNMPALDPTRLLSRKWHELERRKRLVKAHEMPVFYTAIMSLDSRALRDLLLVGLFTGWRETEISGLRWDEVDLRDTRVSIPGKRMKSGKDFDLPMSRQLADLLIRRRALGNDGPFVFPANSRSGHSRSMRWGLEKVAASSGIAVSPHDLRRGYISIAATCPIPPISIKLLVAHSTRGDVTDGYTVLSEQQIRNAAQVVADRIEQLCGVSPPGTIRRS
jgi:integrase